MRGSIRLKEPGTVIVEAFAGIDPMSMPAVLVASHRPFTRGKDADKSVENAVILEEAAMMAWHTMKMNPHTTFSRSCLTSTICVSTARTPITSRASTSVPLV